MKNSVLNNNTGMNMKNQKVVLYLVKVVIQLNDSCNNIYIDRKISKGLNYVYK